MVSCVWWNEDDIAGLQMLLYTIDVDGDIPPEEKIKLIVIMGMAGNLCHIGV